MTNTKSASATALAQVPEVVKATDLSERSMSRKLAESSLYDFKPTARALLREIAWMALSGDEFDTFPKDMPQAFKDDRKGWTWMSQWKLGLRVGISESQTHRWIKQFEKDGVITIRYWNADNKSLHAQYKINEEVVDTFQRPSQIQNVERPKRAKRDYKSYKNKGQFKKGSDQRRANMEKFGVEDAE
jgi:hypothetical protein